MRSILLSLLLLLTCPPWRSRPSPRRGLSPSGSPSASGAGPWPCGRTTSGPLTAESGFGDAAQVPLTPTKGPSGDPGPDLRPRDREQASPGGPEGPVGRGPGPEAPGRESDVLLGLSGTVPRAALAQLAGARSGRGARPRTSRLCPPGVLRSKVHRRAGRAAPLRRGGGPVPRRGRKAVAQGRGQLDDRGSHDRSQLPIGFAGRWTRPCP
jgi:hypothetical protein